MGEPALVAVPPMVTVPDVDVCAAGTWKLSTGEATFTAEDWAAAIDAAACPAVGDPVIKIGHTDPRFKGDGEPAIGHVTNLTTKASGQVLAGDFAGMPGWLAAIGPSAYARRSIEGEWDMRCQIGHVHPFVITAVALLGVAVPGVGVLGDLGGLDYVAALYGVQAAAGGGRPWRITVDGGGMVRAAKQGDPGPVTVDDVRREYYSTASYSMWITSLSLDPPQLIVADEATDKLFRVPYTIANGTVEFGDAQEVQIRYTDVASALAGGRPGASVVVYATAAASRAGVAAGAIGAHTTATTTGAWDGAAQWKNLTGATAAAHRKATAWVDAGAADKTANDAYKFIHHEVADGGAVGDANLTACSTGIGVLNGGRGGTTIPTADRQGVYRHLAKHLSDGGQEPPELAAVSAVAAAALARLRTRRGAVAAADADEDVRLMIAGLDETLDQASALVTGTDTTTLPAAVAEALNLLTAAEAVADQLMDLLGIPDPDDDDSEPGDVAAAAHGPFTGDHEHAHSAFGSQGSDAAHTHMHTHTGDAVHDHHGAPTPPAPAAGAGHSSKGGGDMPFTDEQAATIRAKLGLPADAELTEDALAQAIAGLEEAGRVNAAGRLPQGVIAVDRDAWEAMKVQASKGEQALERMRRNERDQVLDAAIRAGKFAVAARDRYARLWDADPENTRQVIAGMTPGVVPMDDVGLPGNEDELLDEEYRKLFPPGTATQRG